MSVPNSDSPAVITIGVLALQGAFHEHMTHLSRIPHTRAIAVRTPDQLSACNGLVIPGGESTAIALGAERCGLLEPLRRWVRDGKPTWGTCAGMIMLAREATGGKKSQELIGGWDGRVSRNGWGSQVDSFETPLDIPVLLASPQEPFPGVFIRAPVVERILPADEVASSEPFKPVPSGLKAGQELNGIHLVHGEPSSSTPTPSLEPPSLPLPNLASYGSKETVPTVNSLRLTVAPPLDSSEQRPPVQVVARLPSDVRPNRLPGPDADVVALRQGNVFVTSFHPELTRDRRLHEWWVGQCVRGGP